LARTSGGSWSERKSEAEVSRTRTVVWNAFYELQLSTNRLDIINAAQRAVDSARRIREVDSEDEVGRFSSQTRSDVAAMVTAARNAQAWLINADNRLGENEPPTSSLSGLLSNLAHVRQARSWCLRCCPGVAVITLSRSPHRARSGHVHGSGGGGPNFSNLPGLTASRCFLPPSLARAIPHIFRISDSWALISERRVRHSAGRHDHQLRRPVCAAGRPAFTQVSRGVELSRSDHNYPALTAESGTQRARRLRSRLAVGTPLPPAPCRGWPASGPGRLPPGPWFLTGGGAEAPPLKGWVPKMLSAKRSERIFGCPLTVEGHPRTLSGPSPDPS
jgi:hypothetical protein